MAMANKTVSLVLGGGGARGMTHIGVIRYLEDHGYQVRYVSGSSIGALVGGIYAAGKLDTYADWVCALELGDVVRLLDLSLSGEALFKGERIISVLRKLVGEHDIESLPIGFTAIATDLSHQDGGREVWLNKGPLFAAIRASIAAPSVFTPVTVDGRVLVDGSVTNPVPVGPTLNDQTDLTVAVNLNGRFEASHDWASVQTVPAAQPEDDGLLARFRRERIAAFFESNWPLGGSDSGVQSLSMRDLVIRSMETMEQTITQVKFAANPPDITVSIPRNLCSFFEFYRARELIEYGYKRAEKTFSRLD